MTALQIGGCDDHVHALVQAPPIYSPSEIAQYLKGESSKWIHEEFPAMRDFGWQDGYGAFTHASADKDRLIEYIKTRYPHAEVHIDICAATQTRQEAVAAQARGADLTIVVGDPRSNNTNRLVQVSEELAGVPAIRIEDLSQLNPAWLEGKKRVAVTAGASTPSQLTREVIRYIEQYQPATQQ